MFSNRYIFIYSSIMVILAATGLTLASVLLKPYQDMNRKQEKMQNILLSANIEAPKKTAQEMFDKYITNSFVVDVEGNEIPGASAFNIDLMYELKKKPDQRQLPVFICTLENGEKSTILPLRGKGLWGPIWGYVSLSEDFVTVKGSMFDHKGETPGLGSEIDTRQFQTQFIGKKIFDDSGDFTSIRVLKGGLAKGNIHAVDAISGGTITSNGVNDMLKSCLTDYMGYINKNRKKS